MYGMYGFYKNGQIFFPRYKNLITSNPVMFAWTD